MVQQHLLFRLNNKQGHKAVPRRVSKESSSFTFEFPTGHHLPQARRLGYIAETKRSLVNGSKIVKKEQGQV